MELVTFLICITAPLLECTKEERVFIRYSLADNNVRASEICGRIVLMYGDGCMRQREVSEWVEGGIFNACFG
jgi:hypothetical protein